MVLYFNLSLWCEIIAYINDLIVQQNIILICNVLKHHFNCNKKTKKISFNEKKSMKFYRYKMTIIKNNFFQKCLKLWSLD